MVYMYHSFLIHSPADGHLGCFHVLAMINSAAMNIGVHVSLSDFGFLGVYAQEWDWQHPFSQGQLSDKRYNCKVSSQPSQQLSSGWLWWSGWGPVMLAPIPHCQHQATPVFIDLPQLITPSHIQFVLHRGLNLGNSMCLSIILYMIICLPNSMSWHLKDELIFLTL